jgi:hypothetical protein
MMATVTGNTGGPTSGYDLEAEIGRWRSFVVRRHGVSADDVEELEDHLRSRIDELTSAGLGLDEAFLIAVKRMGALDELSREFAAEHSERLWKQLVLTDGDGGRPDTDRWRELAIVAGLAASAAVAVKIPGLFGASWGEADEGGFYIRNASLLVLPFLAGYFGWKRSLRPSAVAAVAAVFAAGALLANVYPFGGKGHTEALTGIHLPIVLWAAVGVAYAGGAWRSERRRMDFIRFSGEWFVYYTLLALGGGLLAAFTAGAFEAIDIDTETFIADWLMPCGAAGAVVVAGWLVEAKQGVIESMAPVLARVFTPMFSLLLASFLVTLVATRSWLDVDRDLLIFFDLLLVVVLGLLLYCLSARPLHAPPGITDWISFSLVATALVIDVLVLAAVIGRISEFGFSANKTAALGENVILFVNLAWSARLYLEFLTGQRGFGAVTRWQTSYLPVVAGWAAVVVIAFPPLFGFD